MATPKKHHTIVALETFWTSMPKFELPPGYTFTLIEHTRSTAAEAAERIRSATIVVTTIVPLNADALSEANCPDLQFIALMASGSDCLDLPTCRRRGITVSNCKGANVAAVSEHALSMCFAARRMFGPAQRGLRSNAWPDGGMQGVHGMFNDTDGYGPPSWEEEVLGLVGYGPIAQRMHTLGSALGMQVMVADRKTGVTGKPGRMPFLEVLKQATLIVCCIPKNPETVDLLSTAELQVMRRNAIVVNVSRGGIVNEDALLDALRRRTIYGAGLDVWATEPSGPVNTALLREDTEGLNLVTTPHSAWYAQKTFKNYQDFIKENVYAWCDGKAIRIVE